MPALPESLSKQAEVLWELPLARSGLGGIAATDEYVLFADRDLDDFHDLYRCLDANTGEILWEVEQLAIGSLDYGNSPRATPLINDGHAFFLGAHGDLLSVEISTGEKRWQKNLRSEFQFKGELPWGYCGSPLIADGKLIVNAGGPDASIVAFDPKDGRVIWQTPGFGPSYGSLLVAKFGGKQQIVGHDAKTIGGWDVATGERLWTIEPDAAGDFNVPTPLKVNGQLLVATENNGARLFGFMADGRINPAPLAHNRKLRPDMSTPIVVGNRLFCVKRFLYCVDVESDLEEVWRIRDKALSDYAAIIASDDRVLVVGRGELLLLNANGEKSIVARQTVFDGTTEIYSHPALVGDKLYIRGESALQCLRL